MIILRPPPSFQDIDRLNAVKTILSAVRRDEQVEEAQNMTDIATWNRNADGIAHLRNTGGSDSTSHLIPFSGEGRRVSRARKSMGTIRSRQQKDMKEIVKEMRDKTKKEGNTITETRATPIKSNKSIKKQM